MMVDTAHLPDGHVPSAKGSELETGSTPFRGRRTSFYIDGFNLYHSIDDLDDPELKWLDLMSLAKSYLTPGDSICDVYYFTALSRWDEGKRARHQAYIDALVHSGVRVVRGIFSRPRKFCHTSRQYCREYAEKKTDVGIAVTLLADGFEGQYDKAFLLSADSDHVPLAERFKVSLPNKRLIHLAPPNRLQESRELAATIGRSFQLTAGRLRSHPLPPSIYDTGGKFICARPSAYGPHAS
jgi:uncharacterized LabA/DUF88 family protein